MPQLILELKGRELRRLDIRKKTTTIGRDGANDLVIDNPGISRHHAEVKFEGTGWRVVDAGSSNGLFVNGQRRTSHPLREGDKVQVGKFAVVFTERGGVPAQQLLDDVVAQPGKRGSMDTTHLSPEDMAKLLHAIDNDRRAPPDREEALQRRSRSLGWLSVVLGLMLLGALGVTGYLLWSQGLLPF